MKKRLWTVTILLTCLIGAAGCGSGGNSGIAGGNLGGEVGELTLVGHEPVDDALQVEVDAEITLHFDGAIDASALVTPELSLRKVGSEEVIDGSFRQSSGGRSVHFQPASELEPATNYEYSVAPTLCDRDFRTLDATPRFVFRTVDEVAPQLVASSVEDRAVDVDRRAPIVFEFDEALDASSIRPDIVALRDAWGSSIDVVPQLVEKRVLFQPVHDLPGIKDLILTVRGGSGALRDRSGNEFAEERTIRFRTAADTGAPSLVSSFPADDATNVSPAARLELVFDEAIDPNSYEPSKLTLIDAFENSVPVSVSLSRNLRTVYLQPEGLMRAGDTYRIAVSTGLGALTDVSGNAITASSRIDFNTGIDTSAPTVTGTSPSEGARDVPAARLTVQFSEALRASTINSGSVRLTVDGTAVSTTMTRANAGTAIEVLPIAQLPNGSNCSLEIVGGYGGVQDENGNPLASSFRLGFTAIADNKVPELLFVPENLSAAAPTTSRIVITSSIPLDPSSVSDDSIEVRDMHNARIQGSLAVVRERCIVFAPSQGLPSINVIRVVVRSGLDGIRGTNGSALKSDKEISFRTAAHSDTLAPEVSLTFNKIAASRREGLVLPRSGFTIDVSSYDLGSATVDPSTLQLSLSGPGSVPSRDELFAMTTFSGNLRTRTVLDQDNELELGQYTLTAQISDTSGNTSTVASLSFEVGDATRELRPFERVQLVWAMFDTDRDGGGRGDGVADFRKDLLDFGLGMQGDPLGTNDRLHDMVRDGAIRVANTIFGRSAQSARVDDDSIRLRIVTTQPCSAPHMKMAIGGLDPSGDGRRSYGSDSTGVLGRALFDYRNSVLNENNTNTSPALGVFVSELFLYQARLYLDLYPHYITRFGRTFGGLCPHMGGTPAGKHTHDAKVLATNFDYGAASPEERARWDEIHTAADNLARAIGVILAHEIGHSIGLVPTGEPSRGLHGDQTLHNRSSGIDDVMSAILGYESLTTIDFAFRPLNLAYLRERVLLK